MSETGGVTQVDRDAAESFREAEYVSMTQWSSPNPPSLEEAFAQHRRRTASRWQSIESSPKDGTEVLGWDGVYMTPIKMLPRNYFGDGQEERWHPLPSPTHWQPLPPPPADPTLSRGQGDD